MHTRIAAIAFAGFFATASCGGDSATAPTVPGGGGGGTTTPTVTTAVAVGNNTFTPSAIQVSVGATVTWTWDANAITHNVTFADGGGSGDMGAGATFTKKFSTAGTFAYSCTIHNGMNGSVLVK